MQEVYRDHTKVLKQFFSILAPRNAFTMHLLLFLLLATLAVARRPNILFILTDDQGKHVGGLEHMPKLQVNTILHMKNAGPTDGEKATTRPQRSNLS